jgi:hypothetical protein
MEGGRKKIGAILKEAGHITEDDVQRVLEYQQSQGGFFGQALISLGLVSPEEVEQALASQMVTRGGAAKPKVEPPAPGAGAAGGTDETK